MAQKHKPPRKPRVTNRSLVVERALDVIDDYLHGLEDADQRAAIVERLVALASQFEAKPPKRKAKNAKVQANAKTAALQWTGHDYSCSAPAGGGEEYEVRQVMIMSLGSSMKREYFSVTLGQIKGQVEKMREIGTAPTQNEGKTIAEKHYASQGEGLIMSARN
jgi:hypothetical protein